jgi:2-polyprenyl-3-methyl-5-hydroxy-6-metoxy-1,4-benzoquinol methylase
MPKERKLRGKTVRALGALVKYGISDKVYVADAYGSEILARLNRAPRFTRWMADTIRPYVGDRVLDIGAGIGNLTTNLVPRAKYHASDINPHYLDRLETLKQARPYLQVHYTDASAAETYPAEQFDTVICMNVVEHIENDVEALSNIRKSLDKNGRAIVLVPNGPRLFGSLDKVLGHYRRYTREQLLKACQNAGFTVEKVLKFNRIGTPGWWLNGRILKKETFGFWQIKLLNFLVPFIRPIDRFLPLPHLSWIIILRAGPQA